MGRTLGLDLTKAMPDESLSIRGGLVKAFSGDFCRVDRQGRPPVVLQRPCLAALWLVQPDKVEKIFNKKFASEGGLLPRFLVCQVNCKPMPIDRRRAPESDEPLRAWNALIASLLSTYRCSENRIVITPAAGAIKLLDDHHNRLVERRNGDLQFIESYVARWNEQAWRLALVLHAALWGPKAHRKRLSPETARNAIEVAKWFANQQLAKLVNGREASQQQLVDAVLRLCRAKPAGIKAKDVYRKRLVDKPEAAHDLLKQLEVNGVLVGQDVQPPGGGKPSRTYKALAA